MNKAPIIKSLLETDLYKFTMWQTMLHRHPSTTAEYRFFSRAVTSPALEDLLPQINEQLDLLCKMRFSTEELDYLRSLRFIKSDFVDFLSIFQFRRDFIEANIKDGQLSIVARGPQVHVMAFEIFVLAIVSELHFQRFDKSAAIGLGRTNLQEKIAKIRKYNETRSSTCEFVLFDYGLRRRFENDWHAEVVSTLQKEIPNCFKGTSNVYLAWKLGLVPIGTMAHEYLQTYQGLGVRLRDHQKMALEDWVQEYRGDLGTALTDVIGMKAFLSDFDRYYALLFDSIRHDSGDPIWWGELALAHYAKLRIDATTKRLVFSDGLNIDKAISLHSHFADRVQTAFGIGTNLTCDVGLPPINIVMKLMRCNDQPVAKLSDSPGKTLCDDPMHVAYLRKVFGVEDVPT